MRSTPSKSNYSIRDALLGCLLVSSFESFLGHNYACAMHAQNGLNIFYLWFDQQRRIRSRSTHQGSPNAVEVEDDLVSAMHRLDVQVLAFSDSRPMETHASLTRLKIKTLAYMPSSFLLLSQARSFWDSICSRTFHFLAFALYSEGNTSVALMLRGPTMPYP
jgi:hypothetical protein